MTINMNDLARRCRRAGEPLEDLLRLAAQASSDNGEDIADAWIDEELNGFAFEDRLPPYRILYRNLLALKDGRYTTVYWNRVLAKEEQKRAMTESISVLDKLILESPKNTPYGGPLLFVEPVLKGLVDDRQRAANVDSQFFAGISTRQVASMFTQVRRRLLEWAVEAAKTYPCR